MNRYQAFAVHITIAAVVLTSTLGSLVFLFYPDFYFHAEGVWSATRIVIMVDLVLGPLLTLIVFKPGKKGLKFDLALIATVQISALIYGIYILYSERPAYLVFSIDRFEVAIVEPDSLSELLELPGSADWKVTTLPAALVLLTRAELRREAES